MTTATEQTHIRARLEELRGIEQDQIRDGWSYAQRQPIRDERLELKRQWQAAAARGAVIDAARVLRKEIEHQGVPSLESCAVLCERLHHLDDQANESGPQQAKCCPECTCSNPSGVSNPPAEPSERPIVVGSTWSRKRDGRQVHVTSLGPVEPKGAPGERVLDYEGKDVFGHDLQWRFLQEFTWVSDPPTGEPPQR